MTIRRRVWELTRTSGWAWEQVRQFTGIHSFLARSEVWRARNRALEAINR
jgi:hypothetical protein